MWWDPSLTSSSDPGGAQDEPGQPTPRGRMRIVSQSHIELVGREPQEALHCIQHSAWVRHEVFKEENQETLGAKQTLKTCQTVGIKSEGKIEMRDAPPHTGSCHILLKRLKKRSGL